MKRLAVLARPALLLAGLLAAGLALRSGIGRQALTSPAQLGMGGFLLVATAAGAVGVPRQVVAYAAGLGFGLWLGCLLALLAEVAACMVDFYWARIVARQWAATRIRGRLARLDGALARRPFGLTLTLRLLPVGSNIALNLVAGVSGIATLPFLAASALGYVPQTVVFTLLGTGVGVGQNTQIIVAVALFVLATLGGAALMLRSRSAQDVA